MQHWVTKWRLGHCAQWRAALGSWCVLTAPWLGQGGSSMGAKSCAGVAEVVSCSSQVADAQLQVSPATHPVFIRRGSTALSEPEEEEAQVPSASHCWWAQQCETALLHSASLPSYLANQLQGPLGWAGFTAVRILLYPTQSSPLPMPVLLIQVSICTSCSGLLTLAGPSM